MTRNSQDSRSNLTRPVRYNSLARRCSGYLATASLALGAALCFPASAVAPNIKMSPKDYARVQLSTDHYKCLLTLYGKESAWNERAVGNLSGKHQVYGIPQGKSIYLKTATGIEQVRWGLSYIANRYGKVEGQPNTCAALKHWKKYKWH